MQTQTEKAPEKKVPETVTEEPEETEKPEEDEKDTEDEEKSFMGLRPVTMNDLFPAGFGNFRVL